jgi:hypothetical protein
MAGGGRRHGGPGRGRHGGPPRGGKPTGRRLPPPESTGAETDYLAAMRESEAPIIVELNDGRKVEGVLRYYDRDMVKVEAEEGPGLFIRKADIRVMYPAGESDS